MLLMDSNALLTPALTYYAFDICGGYWNWITQAATAGHVKSISPVKRELRQKDDQIRNWIDFHAADLFLPDNAAITNTMGQVATWATSNGYTTAAVAEFLSKADSYLVAYAMLGQHQIVTLETSTPGSQRRIKIPDAGNAFGVSSITPFEMLRQHGVRL
ncbi:DUF4411 family protein [Gluconacetobacter asukensis]|uniref:DUF4411 family protein n=1 Tax=Gluconacetobacter asukensis TaxID=1017181 RepID=A0A7W4IYZ8_9PROT|nr:DUF4411 family protein [Gluconacetobacter asukensis]MBB2171663.1 DUF4411 family protein [Gluconacetobacter asukensis]